MAKQDQAHKRHANTIDERDLLNLRRSKYEEQRHKFTTTFVLQHKNYPGKVAKIKAISPVQACGFLRWKPNQVRVLEVIQDDPSTPTSDDVSIDPQAPQQTSIM